MALGGDTSHQRYTADGREQIEMVGSLTQVYADLGQQQLDDLKAVESAQQQATAQTKATGAAGSAAYGATATAAQGAAGAIKAAQGAAAGLMAALGPIAIAAAAVTAAINFGVKWAAETKDITTQGERLQISIAETREALGGEVDDLTLAQLANNAFHRGVVENGRDLAVLAKGIHQISDELGKDKADLLQAATDAISKRSGKRLVELGVILDQKKAEDLYAQQLGKTVQQLTAYERSQAFAKIAIQEISGAHKEGGKAVEDYYDKVARGKTALTNAANFMHGFSDIAGGVRETLRGLDEETLKAFGSRKEEDVRKVSIALREAGHSYEAIKEHAIEVNNIETMRGGQLDRSARLQLERALADMAAEGLKHQRKQIAEAERLEKIEQNRLERIEAAEGIAAAEHEVAVLQVMGGTQEEILDAQRESLMLRIAEAEAIGDASKALEGQRKLELLLLGSVSKKRKGGRGGPTEADRVRVGGESGVAELEHEARVLAATAVTAQQRADAEASQVAAAQARLALELRALEATKAKNALDAESIENKKQAIGREAEIIDIQAKIAARQQEAELARDIATAQAQADNMATAAVIDLDQARLRSAAQQQEADGNLAGLYQTRIEMAAAETLALEQQLDLRQQILELQAPETEAEEIMRLAELKQIEHEREMLVLERGQEAKRMAAAESVRLHKEELARIREHQRAVQAGQQAAGRFLGQGQAIAAAIVDEAIKDDERREKAQLRVQGIVAMGVGALAVVKSVAAFASQNYGEGIAQAAAAGLAFANGAVLISGRIPGDHGSSASAAAPRPAPVERSTSEAAATVDSVPAADRGPSQVGGAGTGPRAGGVTLVIEGDVNGDLSDDFAEKVAAALRDASYGKEAA